MKAPVRMVCGECLESVDLPLDDSGLLPNLSLCPFCGATINSQLGEQGTQSSDTAHTLVTGAVPGGKLWSETWIKGTLGTLGRFQLRELLGDGGFGQVFQAYDPRLDRDVALKVLRQSDPGERIMQRFFREARAAARLEHPNIVPVYDAGRDDGRCWIAYQFIKGRTLLHQRDHQQVPLMTTVRIVRDLADALDHTHRLGIYHRDLKPSNIMIDDQGQPHLTDFGLARRADLDSNLTCEGAILGTPAYMSPEQASGRSNLADERSDVYSLGVVFYELLCGRRPSNMPSQAPAWLNPPVDPPTTPRAFDRSIPLPLERVCLKALAVNPDDRYADARAIRDELDAWMGRKHASMGLTHPLACFAMGVVAALVLVLGMKSAVPPSIPGQPTAHAVAPTTTGAGPEILTNAEAEAKIAAHDAATKQAQAQAIPREPLVGNKSGSSRIYHKSTCVSVRSLKSENMINFNNADEATQEGYRRCQKCQPPEGHQAPAPGEPFAPQE